MHFDIFNGDADGICALHQLRLADPRPDAKLITGVKRDIALLAKSELAEAKNSTITVLDISLDSNRDSLLSLLSRENSITYYDHHAATDIPDSEHLETHIENSANTCTSLIVNDILNAQYTGWAICGAYGDNLHEQGQQLAARMSLSASETDQLREIGELLNYNGYGTDPSDLHYHPEELYRAVAPFENPFDFFTSSEHLINLREGYNTDIASALKCSEHDSKGKNRIFILPNAPWARRVSGVFANMKAREQPDAAHALITENDDATLRISVRAPLNNKKNAVALCKQFPTGGGREAAAGINSMPATLFDEFVAAFNTIYS